MKNIFFRYLVIISISSSILPFLEYLSGSEKNKKSLYWESIHVKTHLKENGTLRVTEDQTFIFNGDWNGGYREVKTYPGQKVHFLSLERYNDLAQDWVQIPEGDIEKVDYFEMEGSNKIKWRSRLPEDPPFERERIRYRIRYIIDGKVLMHKSDGYYLKYDFLFPQREGVVQYFRGELTADTNWLYAGTMTNRAQNLTLIDINPVLVQEQNVTVGNTQHIDLVFQYAGENPPVAREVILPHDLDSLAKIFSGLIIACLIYFFIREYINGRFKKNPEIKAPVTDFLKKYILDLLPEEVGAIWDDKIGPAEVSAILARLVVEKKISSKIIEDKRFLIIPVKSLRLTLLKPKDNFSGYEKLLISGLFVKGDTTDPATVRSYYRDLKKNFNAVKKIRDSLEAKIQKNKEFNDVDMNTSNWGIPLAAFSLALGVTIYSFFISTGTFDVLAGSLLFSGIFLVSSWYLFLRNLRHRIGSGLVIMSKLSAGILLPYLIFLTMAYNSDGEFIAVLASYLWIFSFMISFILNSRSSNNVSKLEFRRNLASIRNYWKKQLRLTHPDLKDEYFPYILALGLSGQIDRWNSLYMPLTGATYSGGSLTGSGGWTGGGGSFGGAGAAGSWSAASLAIGAISISASSSDSSGGGSGGGGGGGW